MRTTAELLANVAASGQYSRQNRYEVAVTPPRGLSLPGRMDSLGRIEMNCSVAQVPGRSVATREVSAGGTPVRKMAHSPQYEDMSLTFLVSDDLLEKKFFDSWQAMVFEDTWGNLQFPSEYYGVVEVRKTSRRMGEPTTGTWVLHDAWPIIVGPVDLSAESGAIATMAVTMSMRHWTTNH